MTQKGEMGIVCPGCELLSDVTAGERNTKRQLCGRQGDGPRAAKQFGFQTPAERKRLTSGKGKAQIEEVDAEKNILSSFLSPPSFARTRGAIPAWHLLEDISSSFPFELY